MGIEVSGGVQARALRVQGKRAAIQFSSCWPRHQVKGSAQRRRGGHSHETAAPTRALQLQGAQVTAQGRWGAACVSEGGGVATLQTHGQGGTKQACNGGRASSDCAPSGAAGVQGGGRVLEWTQQGTPGRTLQSLSSQRTARRASGKLGVVWLQSPNESHTLSAPCVCHRDGCAQDTLAAAQAVLKVGEVVLHAQGGHHGNLGGSDDLGQHLHQGNTRQTAVTMLFQKI